MIKEKKELKKLCKIYAKKLNKSNKYNIALKNYNLDYFINYLYFIRDFLILTEPLEINGNENIKISTLATALEEFNLYKFCELNYFNFNNRNVQKIGNESSDEILQKYNTEKIAHWKNFWHLVTTNIEDWSGGCDDTI